MLVALDHVTIAVRDLDAARRAYETLFGRAPSARASDRGTDQLWFQLANVGVALLSPIASGALADALYAQLERRGEGLFGLGFATRDLARAVHKLGRRGLAASEPHVLQLRDPEHDACEERRGVELDLGATHGVRIQLVERAADPELLFGAQSAALGAVFGAQNALLGALDHVVVNTREPERAVALYGARLGLELALDRSNPAWGSRLMFFRLGDVIVEVAHALAGPSDAGPDTLWGFAFRAGDVALAHTRLAQAGLGVSEVRNGRKPGTAVFSVRDGTAGVPTLVIGAREPGKASVTDP